MYLRGVSGQPLPFHLTSVLSGFPVTGFSGAISGRKILDNGVMVLLSGNIIETSGGTYRANLHGFDISGDRCFFFFTASGCVPVSFLITTVQGVMAGASGAIYPASGINATVPIASISGAVGNSGQFVSVPPASLSGVVANSGLTVTVLPATLSGVMANSGLTVTVPIASISGTVPNVLSGLTQIASGPFVVASVTIASGTTYLASGHNLFWSGQLYPNSGLAVGLLSGQTVSVFSGQLSGHQVDLLSGRSYTASGIFATATATVGSGTVYLASGHGFFLSGQIIPASGMLSGQLVTAASGVNALVPPATLSGVVANSGLFVNVPIASVSGINAVVPKETISGVVANSGLFVTATATVGSGTVYLASGHNLFWSGHLYPNSGLEVGVLSGQLSGQPITLLSGRSYPASGVFVNATATVASGQVYLASGHGLFLSGQLYLASGSLSGQRLDLVSGQSYTASGIFAVATATVGSGSVYLASGHNLFWSGQLYPNSGLQVAALSGQWSGQPVTLLSGRSFTASGINATVPIASISGTNAVVPIASVSGINAVVPIASVSGINAVVPPATLSGVVANSGLSVTVLPANLSGIVANSGLFATVPKETISGVVANSGLFVTATATIGSGTTFLASGHNLFWSGELYPPSGLQTLPVSGSFSGQPIVPLSGLTHLASGTVRLTSGTQVVAAVVNDKSGYTLHSSGLDTISVEAGMNARQALSVAAAGAAGRLAGAGTSLIRIDAAGVSGTIRISGSFDNSGNRATSFLNLPG